MNSREFLISKNQKENKNSKLKEKEINYSSNMLMRSENKYKVMKNASNKQKLNILKKVENLNKNFKKKNNIFIQRGFS